MGVLDDMTKGITERKAKAAGPKLTPVGTEASSTKPSLVGIPDVPEVFLTNEAVSDIAKDLRQQAATLVSVADGLDRLTGGGNAPLSIAEKAALALDAKREKEREADELARQAKAPEAAVAPEETFDERFARLSAAAVDSAFPNLDAESDAPADAPGWTCPKHGGGNVNRLTSRKGRAYYACGVPGCAEFERS